MSNLLFCSIQSSPGPLGTHVGSLIKNHREIPFRTPEGGTERKVLFFYSPLLVWWYFTLLEKDLSSRHLTLANDGDTTGKNTNFIICPILKMEFEIQRGMRIAPQPGFHKVCTCHITRATY